MQRRNSIAFWITVLIVSLATGALAEQGKGNNCSITGTWYGGSTVAYKMTISENIPAETYTVVFEGMYKSSVMNTTYTTTLVRKGNRYEGSGLALITQDPDFLNPPPIGKLPDILVGWFSIDLLDCRTIRNTIPFLGMYFGAAIPGVTLGIWQPGTPWSGIAWVAGAKAPMIDPPDVDMIPVLTGDVKPIVETYRKVPNKVNPALLHQ